MKSMRRKVQNFSIAAGVIAAVSWALCASASDKVVELPAKIIRIQGSARYSLDQKTWSELKKGDSFKGAVLIQTATRSTVDVWLHSGGREESHHDELKENTKSVIRLFESTVLSIDKLTRQKTDKGTMEDDQ